MVHSRDALIPVPDMSALIALLEAAEAGGRELDREIMALTYSWEQRHIGVTCWDDRGGRCCPGAKHMSWVWVDPATGQWKTNAKEGLEFTTSLDAALALAERMLPGWRKFVEVVGDGRGSACVFLAHEAIDRPWFHAPTPALALCIAILRAIPNGYEAAGEVSPNLKAKAQGEGG